MAAHEHTADRDPAAVALDVVAHFEAGRFDEAHALFSPRLREAAPAATVAELWRKELGGRPILTRGPVTLRTRKDGLVTATVPIRTGDGDGDGDGNGDGDRDSPGDGNGESEGKSTGNGASGGTSDGTGTGDGTRSGMDVVMSVDEDGVLHGLRFAAASAAAWSAPGYVAARRRFEEHEVVLGSGADAVPGTVTLPRGRARQLAARLNGGVPAVVLLAGGGAFDRDGTVGPNKPLKDLAWGLATRGIATLRFDKPTLVHAEEFEERGYTLTDEYLPPAVAAIRLLQAHRAVDPHRVFVLGHSAGGKVAPRVARARPSIAGLILLAADARPMHESAVRVARHVAGLSPGPEAEAALARLAGQAARAADPALDPHTPATDLPFGLPAAYWLDLRGYDPVGTAAAADRPMFIAQGARDYQVTVEHDLALWRDGLGDRPEVTCRVYPADDHLFFPGTEPATPASYQVAQHVDPVLVTDIAAWIRSRGRAAAADSGADLNPESDSDANQNPDAARGSSRPGT